ncbi:MAG TPA: DUF3048 domain-containing protein [Firmicutes bacterium]|nr:DUF3048 domain-containing protein [Bacillota bacterium]
MAVVIDNHRNAMPQAGVASAEIVYEAVTEGGITRLLAVFHCTPASRIGPVRSARPYFAYIAKEWGAIFAHCGGLEKDVAPIEQLKVIDANELLNPEGFWRDKARSAPHNLFTSVEALRKRLGLQKAVADLKKRWEFSPWSPSPVKGMEVRYSKKYAVRYYLYEAADGRNCYRRMADGRESIDEDGTPVEVSNVLVQAVPTKVVYADGGVEMRLIGEGKAWYLLGGRAVTGSWKKKSSVEPTQFFDDRGNPIRLTPGGTWVQIVPAESATVTFLEK